MRDTTALVNRLDRDWSNPILRRAMGRSLQQGTISRMGARRMVWLGTRLKLQEGLAASWRLERELAQTEQVFTKMRVLLDRFARRRDGDFYQEMVAEEMTWDRALRVRHLRAEVHWTWRRIGDVLWDEWGHYPGGHDIGKALCHVAKEYLKSDEDWDGD